MSDQSPPPKPKPGSLRDRIAAFENKGSSAPTPGPPPPRPKPGGLHWKPRPPSPPTQENSQSNDNKPASSGGMSASDALESIGRAGSLKERMAALQGKGAFGSTPPPIAPKPNVDRPKWKPPPSVPVPVSSEDEPKDIACVDQSDPDRDASRSPPPRAAASPSPDHQGTSGLGGDAAAQSNVDPEEEERQRRATIAARMARLGGAKFGMSPPIFAPKPVARKSEPAPSAAEAGDHQAVIKESGQALATSPPPDLPAVASPVPEAVTESERKDEPESPPPVPTRAPASMPVPAGPRRAAPPRKKAPKMAPTTALPEPPVEGAEGEAVRPSPIADESSPAGASYTSGDFHKETGEVTGIVEATHDEHPNITADVRHPMSPPASTEAFHEPADEPEKQEAQEELVGSQIDEISMHTAFDDQQVPLEPSEHVGAEQEEEEARRQRVAAKLAQIGASNPLSGPSPIPRQSLNEADPEAPVDVEDEVNINMEELGETISSLPVGAATHDAVQAIKHDAAEHVETDQVRVDKDDPVPAHRDGESTVASCPEEQDDSHNGRTLPRLELFEDRPIKEDWVPTSSRETDTFDVLVTAPLEVEAPERRLQGNKDNLLAGTGYDALKEVVEVDGASPPLIARQISPPPANLWPRPAPPSSPPRSPPTKTPLQALRVDGEECPSSPDMPPRPVPPPGRSGTLSEEALSSPPRRSIPPPPRRTSTRRTDPLAETPSSPPRQVSCRPATPPIITTLSLPEQVMPKEHKDHVAEEISGNLVPPQEDEASVRRRAIAERMARLGGVRFGAPPPMNPLSRPPLPPAPPPTSIPPDEPESGGKEEGPEEEEAVRKQRIAAKLAGMGGMRLGMLPPAGGLPPASAGRLVERQEDSETEDAVPPVPVPAPPQRPPPTRKPPPPVEEPVQRLEHVGRESRGSSDDGVRVEAEESEIEEVRYSDAEVPPASGEDDAGALSPPLRSTHTARSAEVLPTPPPRMASCSPPPGRPSIPTIPTALLGRRPSGTSVSTSSSRQASLDEPSPGETPTISGRASESAIRAQSEYVMVEAEDPDEDGSPEPPFRRKSTRGGPARSIPLPPVPPPSAIDPPGVLASSAQWELPSIPQGAEFGEGSEMTSSGWSEDSTAVHVPTLAASPPGSRGTSGKVVLQSSSTSAVSASITGSGSASGRRSLDQQVQLTTDELVAIGDKTGTRVVEAATTLFEKSKRALVGDGSHAGFVRAVLAQVSGVSYPSPGGDDWGYVVYAQTGNAVQRRVSDILPGDIIAFWDAKLKGHRGLHTYTQTVGTTSGESGGPLVGIVSEIDGKKNKVKVWQANQHVGQQTVENVSYRLEDLKSGQVKVYRVLEA